MFDFSAAREHMVESQVRTNDVTDPALQKALRSIAREDFVPEAKRALAYSDANVEIEPGRYLLRPRDFAKLVHESDIAPTDIVLDVACGTGYSTAVLAQLAETVVGLEDTDSRVEHATNLLNASNIMNAAVVKGELKAGAPEHGPFDVIFINGAVTNVPKTWLDQLASGGRLVVVVPENGVGQARIYTRVGNATGDRVAFDSSIPVLPGFEPKAEFVF